MKKIIFILAAVALIASPAMAVDWNFYGSARMATFYQSRDYKDSTASDLTGVGVLGEGRTKDANTNWNLQGNSRLGATVKGESIGGRFEFGINESSVTSRRIFGTWDFGAATLKVGKDYTPVKQFISGQVFDGDLGLLGIGTAYGSRVGQVALSFGGFEVALVSPRAGLIDGLDAATTVDTAATPLPGTLVRIDNADFTGGDVDEIIPKIEAAFGMSFDTWNFKINGGYQYYEIEDVVSTLGTQKTVDVKAYTIGADAGVNFGPAYVKGAINYAVNPKEGNWHLSNNSATYTGGSSTDDIKMIMGALVAGFKFTDQLSLEGGFGYRQDDPDANDQKKDKQYSYYLQGVISMAPGVNIVPEVGYYDLQDDIDGDDEGKQFYLGAKWQIDF